MLPYQHHILSIFSDLYSIPSTNPIHQCMIFCTLHGWVEKLCALVDEWSTRQPLGPTLPLGNLLETIRLLPVDFWGEKGTSPFEWCVFSTAFPILYGDSLFNLDSDFLKMIPTWITQEYISIILSIYIHIHIYIGSFTLILRWYKLVAFPRERYP